MHGGFPNWESNLRNQNTSKKLSPGVNAPDDDDDEVIVDGEENQDGGDDWRDSSMSPLQTTFQVQGHLNPERGCIHWPSIRLFTLLRHTAGC